MRRRPDAASRLASEAARAARRAGAERTLFLDLDGTLAPIVPRPGDVRVPGAALESLRELLDQGWRVVVVSGRPESNLRRVLNLSGVRLFGSHGFEGAWPGGRRPRIPAALRRRVRGLLRAGRRAAQGIPGAFVESKPAGVGFHDRAVPPSHLRLWRRRVRALLDRAPFEGLEVVRGHRTTEVHPARWTKGTVVATRPARSRRPAGAGVDRSLMAFGDDVADEDMFRAIRGEGVGVVVARRARASAATRRLASPEDVCEFLDLLARSGS